MATSMMTATKSPTIELELSSTNEPAISRYEVGVPKQPLSNSNLEQTLVGNDGNEGVATLRKSNNHSVHLKFLSAGFSFFVAGVNDGSLGALIPYVIRVYGLSTAIVSIM